MSATMTRRLQLLLDEERYELVAAEASRQRVSVATVIRDAIDHSLGYGSPDKTLAFETIVAAEPMDVPDPDDLVAEIAELRGRRDQP